MSTYMYSMYCCTCHLSCIETAALSACPSLAGCVQVLKYETACQPHILGGSVFGYNDAYRRLHSFLRQWRAAQVGLPQTSPMPGAAEQLRPQPASNSVPAFPQQAQTRMPRDPPEVATAGLMPTAQASVRAQQGRGQTTSRTAVATAGQDDEACQRMVPYIVSVDVSRAFDNVDAEVLLGIIEPLLRCPEYLIIKYTEVMF